MDGKGAQVQVQADKALEESAAAQVPAAAAKV